MAATVGGLVVVALVVMGLLATQVFNHRQNGPGVGQARDGTPGQVSLLAPEELADGWQTLAEWFATRDDPGDPLALDQPGWDGDAANISADFGGADAIVQEWVNATDSEDYWKNVYLRAVAAMAPGYFVSSQYSAERSGTDLASQEVQHFGDVSCHVGHAPPYGPESADNTWAKCMRTSENLTVWVDGPMGLLPVRVAAMVENAWRQMGGSPSSASWPLAEGSDRPLSLPAAIGDGLTAISADPGGQLSYGDVEARDQADAEALSAAYGGAAADVQTYVNPGSVNSGTGLRAVRSPSPVPYVRYEDLARLNLLAPINEQVQVGEVYCTVMNHAVLSDGDPSQLNPAVVECFRSGPELTIWLTGNWEGDVAGAASIVDQAWAAVGTG